MKTFLDTNIVIYANDSIDPIKQEKAITLIQNKLRSGTGVISTQVLQEYTINAIRKLGQAVPVIMHQLHLLESFAVVIVTPQHVRRGLEITALYNINFWDSLIIATAEAAGCDKIFSEDFNAGQFYCGIKCENPFAP